ncbi:MAG: response regulator [Solirubrobacterales bacterium]
MRGASEAMLRVVLCDDHEIVREAIGARLENAQGIEVIAEAGDGRELIEIARRLAPDVAIVDLRGQLPLEAGDRLAVTQPHL